MKPCLKREVCAVIVSENGEIVVGQNLIKNNKIFKCPRSSGEGYEKCIHWCRQPGHAEIMAIEKAKERNFDLTKSTLFLHGHNKVCYNCTEVCKNEGLKVVIV